MILDTNAISDWCDADKGLLRVLPKDRPIYLPVIVIGEYRFGIKAARDHAVRCQWMDAVEASVVVLHVDTETAHMYGEVREELRKAKNPIPENDIWIAALARQHHLPLLSRDAHFDKVSGIRRVGWR